MKLSIIIPTYNEEKTLALVIEHISTSFMSIPYEIIIVDDGSTDRTKEIALQLISPHIFYIHKHNEGKGSAVRLGLSHASGDYIAIQDADLEYNPSTLYSLWTSVTNQYNIIYGTRSRSQGYFLNRLANYLLSSVCNFLYQSNLYDIYTCYKILPRKLTQELNLTSNGFEIEAEITAKLLLQKKSIREIPIPYNPRTISAGKKIRSLDGLIGLWTLLKCRF